MRAWSYAMMLCLTAGCTPAAPAPSSQPPAAVRSESQPPSSERVVVQAEPPPLSAAPQTVFRPDDQRPVLDDTRLATLGIRRYESRRLVLYTDLAADLAQPLPPLIDAAYDALCEYFGPLPPARDGREFQMTGYLLCDEQRFREAHLIPEDLPAFEHGRHRRNEFWIRDQEFDYYRRHLLIHEATHCVMTYLPDTRAPVWYLEGMAELFGTHRVRPEGTFEWGTMPDTPEHFAGLGRITLIRQEFAQDRALRLNEVMALKPEEYLAPAPYAWSWALCHFLARHPRYRDRFRELGRYLQGTQFESALRDRFAADERDLETEWALFTVNLQYGYDFERAVIEFIPGQPLTASQPQREVVVRTDRGWQSSRVLLEAGQQYEVTATGRFTLAQQPKPWLSEPQGVSIRYFDGSPLGELQGCLRREARSSGDPESMLKVLSIGRSRQFTAPITGTLYLRVNDSWSELADNTGEVQVSIRRVEAHQP